MAKSSRSRSNPTRPGQMPSASGSAAGQPGIKIATIQQAEIHTGPLPHPEILKRYDEVVPGGAERIFILAEKEAFSRNRREDEVMRANIEAQERQLGIAEQQTRLAFRSDLIGQIFGMIVCILCVVGAVFLGMNNREWLGGLLAAIPTGAVIKAFFVDRTGIKKK